MKSRLINIILRSLTLVSKLVLIFILAHFFAASEVGVYGLISTSIGYMLYLVGLEFYIYTNRKIITSRPYMYGAILKNQFALYIINYILIISILTPIVFYKKLMPLDIYFWIIMILFFEHWAQEFNRLLISLSKQIIASQILFIRSGLWILISIPFIIASERYRNIDFILFLWLLGSIIACLIALLKLGKEITYWPKGIKWSFIRAGIIISLPFVVSTLATRALFTIDKYWFNFLTNLELLGVYTFFTSISISLTSFLDAAVFSFLYPMLIKAKTSSEQFRKMMSKMIKQTLLLIIVFVIIALSTIEFVLSLIDNKIYLNNQWMFGWTLMASIIFSLGFIPQYGLYALEEDKYIILSSLLGFTLFLITTYIFSFYRPDLAVLLGVNIGLLSSAIFKVVALIVKAPKEYLWKKQKISAF
ncbi:MAG: hypothetical protein E6Q83_02235 [Thiothrix sp.]|nr:MAG: hypothetical protein E6Q83_02235 [Thiothrix sp.]